jgi:hypothetical protein
MVPRITWAVCLLASIITLALGITSTAGPGPGDAFIVAFVLGPYLLLGLLAWRHRRKSIISWLLLAVAVILATWGVCLFGLDSYWYHTDWQYRMSQRMTVLVVPLLQWAMLLMVGLVMLGIWAVTRDDVSVNHG